MPAHLQELTEHLTDNPHTVGSDLEAVVAFMDDLDPVVAVVKNDVYVHGVVVELHNETGYPVGYLLYDPDANFRFVAHADGEDD